MKFLNLIFLFFCVAGTSSCAVTKEADVPKVSSSCSIFWNVVSDLQGLDEGLRSNAIESRLIALNIDDQARTIDCYYEMHAQTQGEADLWAAGVLVNRGHGSDDAFEYFVNWLILLGERRFFSVILDPDSLAKVPSVEKISLDSSARAQSEAFSVFATLQTNSKTDTRLDTVTPSFDWKSTTKEHAKKTLPSLWRLFGAHLGEGAFFEAKAASLSAQEISHTIGGTDYLVGQSYDFPRHGRARLLALVAVGNSYLAKIELSDGSAVSITL
jgi:Protein of unknown function (DUF4240)